METRTRTSGLQSQMLTLELSDSEQALLRDVLETAVSEMGTEISGTDSKDFRDDLKDRREVLLKVIAALGGGHGATGEIPPM
jgi:hypothetical protein